MTPLRSLDSYGQRKEWMFTQASVAVLSIAAHKNFHEIGEFPKKRIQTLNCW